MVGLSGHVVEAGLFDLTSAFGLSLTDFVLSILANIAYYVLTIASWFLTVAGTLLNASINLTLHIKQLLEAVPAVYTAWMVVRDISSMFFIFALLWLAITMILSIEKQKIGDLVKNIIIAGILINFSFFIVGAMIDFSNVISLQFYRAIAPGKEYGTNVNSLSSIASQAFNDGGISDVFMQALRPQSFYKNTGQLKQKDVDIQMIIAGVGGTVVMVIAALSFLATALAFIIRTGMLILLLAFSPLWMAGMVIPQIKRDLSDKWWGHLKANLIFMPVYLLFTYIAMRLLLGDNPPATSIANILTGTSNVKSDGVLGASYFGMILSYVLAIMFIMAPLIAALQVGGKAMSFGKQWGDNFSGWGKRRLQEVGRFAGRNTVGAAAGRINDSAFAKKFYASNPTIGLAASKGLSKVSGAGFGDKKGSYDAVLKQKKKDLLGLQKHVGKEYQATFNEHLAKPSILAKMVGSRAGKQVAADTQKKAAAEVKMQQKKTVQENKNKAEAELKRLEESIEKDSRGVGFAPGKPPTAAELEKLKELKEQISKYNVELGEIYDLEEENRSEKIAEKVAEKSKKTDGDGSKKKDDDKDKPKTS